MIRPYITIIVHILGIILLTQTLVWQGMNLADKWRRSNGLKSTRLTLFLLNFFLVADLLLRLVPQRLHLIPGMQTLGLVYYIPFYIVRVLGIYSFYRFVKLFYEKHDIE